MLSVADNVEACLKWDLKNIRTKERAHKFKEVCFYSGEENGIVNIVLFCMCDFLFKMECVCRCSKEKIVLS